MNMIENKNAELNRVNPQLPRVILNSADPVEIKNGATEPKFFYCRHMQPGLAGYKNERLLVDADAIKKMLPSLNGKPIYINHQDVDLNTMKEKAVGYIADAFWNELDGWAWAKMLIIDEEAQMAASTGWSVSNAYLPAEWGGGGTCNNVEFDRCITDGGFTHMALVQEPRYEEAKIFNPDQFKVYQEGKRQQLNELKNAKENQEKANPMKGFKFFKAKKEEVTAVDADTMVEITNDKGEVTAVPLSEIITEVQNAKVKKNEASEEVKEEMINDNTEVEVGGEKMNMKTLMAKYNAMKKNGAAEATEGEDKAEKENSKVEAKVEAKVETKTDHFAEISNANRNSETITTVDTAMNKLQRGKNRYGSGN
jgi:hypothetical protein